MKSAHAKRRSRPSLAARVRTFWVPGIFFALLGTWGSWALATWPGFHIRSLAITGLAHVTRSEVAARAAIDPSGNVWLFNRGAIVRRIEAIPYVATARVHRSLIASVWIDVSEREVAGCVHDSAGRTLTVDRELRVLESGCAQNAELEYDVRKPLAVVPGRFLHDSELVRLQSDAQILAATADRFRAVRHDAFGALEATLQDGIRIRFGDDEDLDRKQRLIAPILAQLGPRATNVRTVDLRAPATPVVEYRR